MANTFPPTAQQQAFLDGVTNTTSHIALVARAGTGKTTTILLAVTAVSRKFPEASQIVCAYNKAIADEVSDKLKKAGHNDWKRVRAATIHSLGFGLLKFFYKLTQDSVDDRKVVKIIDGYAAALENQKISGEIDINTPNNWKTFRIQIAKLVAVGKQAGVGFFADAAINDVGMWNELADRFDINGFDDTTDMDKVVALTQIVYRDSLNDTKTIDFDDMVLFPLVKNLRVRFGFDFIYLDEAQDLSRSRQALAKKFLNQNGRMIVVGDDRQAIYGFSGADSEALINLQNSLQAVKFPLTVTWRCPKSVVKLAQKYVPDFVAADEAPEGIVRDANGIPADLEVGDAVLCRNTAPLINIAYSLIRAGKPAKVEGRSIGEGLRQMTEKWKVTTINAFLARLEVYRQREVQKAQAKDNDSKVQEVNDRCDTLVEIAKMCQKKNLHSLQDMRDFIYSLFEDGVKDAIVLATYHRSKGREWNRVLLFKHHELCPSKFAKQAWQKRQEENLAYVAITRSKSILEFVNDEDDEKVAA